MAMNWNNAIWLAARQMRDNWTSYLYSALYFAFMGLVLAAADFWTVELALPVLMFILIQPSLSPRYMSFKDDNDVTRHQAFLHSLPIRFDTIIAARVVAMLVAGVVNIPLLFIPFWYIGPDWNSVSHYVAWAVFWIGIAFVGSGLALLQEFWMSFKNWIKLNFVSVIVVVAALLLMLWRTDIRPYTWSVRTANENPWILVISGVVIGIAGLWLGMVAAVRGFREREFST